MVIHAPKPRPVAAGFWTFCDQTGDLRHVDAHADSTVCTRWPLLDRWHRNLIERGVDWLLNAAGAGRERLDAALRVPYPGSRLDRLPPIQSAFWHRMLHGLSGGATYTFFLGSGMGQSGLTVSDHAEPLTRDGWPWSEGPGRGSNGGGLDNVGGGGGGGYGEAGSSGRSSGSGSFAGRGGSQIPVEYTFAAIRSGDYSRENLGMGGGGGRGDGGRRGYGGRGGALGSGIIFRSSTAVTVDQDYTLNGSGGQGGGVAGANAGGGGGGGSGGLFLVVCGTTFTLAATRTVRALGGSAGGSGGGHAGSGGAGDKGRAIICYGDGYTINGTIDAVDNTFQLLPSLPLGQVRVS